MKKLVAACLVAAPLGACFEAMLTPTTPIVTVADSLPANIRNYTVQVCGFLPAAETVAGLIDVFGGPTVPGIVSQIAREICAVVTAPKARRRGTIGPTLHGVLVHGHFVR